MPRIVFIFLALLSFLSGNAFGYARSHSIASPAAKATHSTSQATQLTDHCSLTTSFDFGWDAKNQLVRARTKNHSSAAHAYDLTFTHDAEGRRVQKHVVEYQHGAVVSENFITFVWDGWDLLYERQQLPSGLTTIERKYLWGPDIADGASGGAGGLLLIQETKGNNTQKIIPLYDGTGHVTALTNLNKDLLASYAYGPFGEKISATGPLANSNPWRWATKYFDEETGLYYFGKRYLDPVTGQWLSRELLGESESLNLYSYCHNDPVNRVDVLGLMEVPFDMEEKRRLGELFAAARELEMDILLRRNEATMNEAELHERQQLRLNYFLNKEYENYVAERQSGQPEIKPDPSRPIQETAALCVGGATNEVNAGLNTVFISPVGAETFALKWLGICGSVIAKEARVSALLGSTASGVSRMQLLTAFGKELQFSAQVARSDAAFMQTANAQELLRLSAGVEDGLRRTIASSSGTTSGTSAFALQPESILSKHIRGIHSVLPESGSTAIFRKADVSMAQLKTLTQVTGDEYSMFTLKGQRFVIRGNGSDVIVSPSIHADLLTGKYGRWSGHTHPAGHSLNPGPADQPFLRAMGQKQSGIWGDAGAAPFDQGYPWNIGN